MHRVEYLLKVGEAVLDCYLYHKMDSPVITDYDYDVLYRKLRDYEEEHPDHIVDYSPTQGVGFTEDTERCMQGVTDD